MKSKISKQQQVLNYLHRYGSIDRMTALTHCKVWELGSIVHKLRKRGHNIKTQGTRHKVKYVLFNQQNEPVFSRFQQRKPQAV